MPLNRTFRAEPAVAKDGTRVEEPLPAERRPAEPLPVAPRTAEPGTAPAPASRGAKSGWIGGFGRLLARTPGGTKPEPEPRTPFARRVSRLRTRDRVVTALLWSLLVLGPVLSLMALQRPTTAEGSGATQAQAATQPSSAGSAGPAGFAARFVTAWLGAGRGEEDRVRPYYPSVIGIAREPATQLVTSATVVEAVPVEPGYWQVTTAADLIGRMDTGAQWLSLGTQCFLVGVLASESTGQPTGYTAASLPALVGCPPAGTSAAVGYGEDIPVLDGPLVQTIAELFGAYLSGVGELSRYTAPTIELAPITPAPYVSVTITGLRASVEPTWELSEVPADGTVLDVLINVEALPAGGGVDQLTYALSVTARDGRWELAGLPTIPMLTAEQPPASEGEDK